MDENKKNDTDHGTNEQGENIGENQQEISVDQKSTDSEETANEEIAHLQDTVKEIEDKYKRALADYQNLQRRTGEQRIEWAKSASRDVLLKLLPVLDTLMLAEKHTQDKNFSLSVQQFLQVLQEEGVKKIKTVGEQFDPYTMEAVGMADGKDGEIIEEVRSGFVLNDLVLRSAQVIVGKKG